MPLRDHRTGRAIALDTIPEWFRGADTRRALSAHQMRIGSLSEQHARRVWTDTRAQTATRAQALRAQAGTNDPSGLIILEFVSRLAGHLLTCPRCHQSGATDPGTPETWLLYAVGQRPRIKRALEPVLRELGHRTPRMPPGTAQASRSAVRTVEAQWLDASEA